MAETARVFIDVLTEGNHLGLNPGQNNRDSNGCPPARARQESEDGRNHQGIHSCLARRQPSGNAWA